VRVVVVEVVCVAVAVSVVVVVRVGVTVPVREAIEGVEAPLPVRVLVPDTEGVSVPVCDPVGVSDAV
jgi:hypothetical protein